MMNFAHIHTFAYVPQTYLLGYCSVFITHGGINSIKESIQAAVPMLVIPLDVDQPGNAAKVVHKGLGLAAYIAKETTESLKAKLEALLTDAQYKQQLKHFKEKVSGGIRIENKLIDVVVHEGVVL
jgi:zeaxanthin glucosyltransferase